MYPVYSLCANTPLFFVEKVVELLRKNVPPSKIDMTPKELALAIKELFFSVDCKSQMPIQLPHFIGFENDPEIDFDHVEKFSPLVLFNRAVKAGIDPY